MRFTTENPFTSINVENFPADKRSSHFVTLDFYDGGSRRGSIFLRDATEADELIKAACEAKDLFRAAAYGIPTPLPAGTNLLPPGYQLPGTSYTDGAR